MANQREFALVPPAPEVLAQLYADYLRHLETARGKRRSFKSYLKMIGFTDPTARFKRGDDGRRRAVRSGARLVQVPARAVTGNVRVLVLLVDFPDKPAKREAHEFEDMLFTSGTFQTGSLTDFYTEVTLGKVTVSGTVHGWFRMPRKYDYYVNNKSGTGEYPRNAQKLAEDALAAAKKQEIVFDPMAGGSWNNGGLTPAHPAGLHKLQHAWIELQDVLATTTGVILPPYSKTFGRVVRIRGPRFTPTQSLVLENRRRTGFDRMLPGEGLLVWRVDTSLEQEKADEAAMMLVQADGRHDLNRPDDQDAGDPGDPFPGANKVVSLDITIA